MKPSIVIGLIKPLSLMFLSLIILTLSIGCDLSTKSKVGSRFHPTVKLSKVKSFVQASSTQVVAGSSIQLTVNLRDDKNQPYIAEGVAITFTATGGTSIGTIGAVEDRGDGSYVANLLGVTAGTPVTINGYIDGTLISSAAPQVQVLAGVFSLSDSLVSVSSATVASGQTVTVTLIVKDVSGAQVDSGGLTVLFNNTGGTSTGTFGPVTDNANGTYSAQFTGVTSGSATSISATINGLSLSSAGSSLQVTPGSAAQIQISANNNQSTSVGTAVTLPLEAVVTDMNGNLVPSVSVSWSVTSGGGSVGTCSASTSNSNGIAVCTPTLGTIAGNNTFTASVIGIGSNASFSAVGLALTTISSVNWVVAPSTNYIASSTSPMSSFSAAIKDIYGNVIISNSTTTISLAISSGSGSLTGTTVSNVQVASGVATFNDVYASVAETVTIRATENTANNFVSRTGVIISPATLDSISWTTAPGNTTATSTQNVTVKLFDAYGNILSGDSSSSVTLTAHASVDCSGGAVSSALSSTSQTVSSGVASFSNLGIRKVVVQSVKAILGSKTTCVGNLTITNGVANQIGIYSGDGQSENNGSALSNPMVAQVTDLYGNAVPSASVSWAVATGNGILSGCDTTTDSAGLVQCLFTFGYGQPGVNTITATASGIATPTSFNETGVAVGFTSNWNFSTESDYTISNSSIAQISGGAGELISASQVDSSNAAVGFSGGTAYGQVWDSTNSVMRLDQGGTATYNEEDSNWVPAASSIVTNLKMNGTSGTSIANNTVLTNSMGSFVNTFMNSNGSTSPTTGYSTGKSLQGITFDGNDDYISISNASALTYFTLSMWIKPSSFGSIRCLFNSPGNAGEGNLNFYISGSGQPYLYTHTTDSTRTSFNSPLALVANQWAHIVLVNSSTGRAMYINGIAVVSDTKISKPITLNQIGKSGASNFIGVMDGVTIWSTALGADAVQALYQHTNARYAGIFKSRVFDSLSTGANWLNFSWTTSIPFLKELPNSSASEDSISYSGTPDNLLSGLQGLWKLNEASGTTGSNSIIDSSGKANHGTPTGTPVYANNGMFNRGVYFGGAAYFTVNGAANFPPAFSTTGMTTAFWVRGAPGQADKKLITYGNSFGANPIFIIRINCNGSGTNDAIGFYIKDSGGNVRSTLCSSTTVLDNTWHHVVVTDLNGTVKLYVDGKDTGASLSYASQGDIYPKMHVASEAGAGYFTGYLDEIAVWNRVLSSTEVAAIYRRGGNRLRFQIRSCPDSTCSNNPSWLGSDGTDQSYFSELFNTSSNTSLGTVDAAFPSMTFSNFSGLTVSSNRYFQYRQIMESDDSSTNCNYGSGATWCSPELKSANLGPTHYSDSAPTIAVNSGPVYATITSITETLSGSGCSSGVLYILSKDNSNWVYWNGSVWATADGTTSKANSAATILSQLNAYNSQIGAGTLYLKAFLRSNGASACSIDNIEVQGTR